MGTGSLTGVRIEENLTSCASSYHVGRVRTEPGKGSVSETSQGDNAEHSTASMRHKLFRKSFAGGKYEYRNISDEQKIVICVMSREKRVATTKERAGSNRGGLLMLIFIGKHVQGGFPCSIGSLERDGHKGHSEKVNPHAVPMLRGNLSVGEKPALSRRIAERQCREAHGQYSDQKMGTAWGGGKQNTEEMEKSIVGIIS